MMWALLAAGLLAPPPAPCQLRLGPLVDKIETARAIAEAIVAVRGAHDRDHEYRLVVAPDRDPRYWDASQELITDLPVRGGGGLIFRIRRCDGAVVDAFYAR